MVFFLYVQYGFSHWKRHGNHSRVEKDTGFIIVVKMERLKGTSSQKSFHTPFSESRCHSSAAGGRDNPSRRRLVTWFRSQLFNSLSN